MKKKIIKYSFVILAAFLLVGILLWGTNLKKPEAKILNLPPREQWANHHGYCGEMSIQTAALYYGTYISQDLARKIAGGELLVSENDDKLLNAIKLKFDEWDYKEPTPQYESYLIWIKNHLSQGNPVITTVYVKGMDDPDYDHIIPVVGYKSSYINIFKNREELVYNDNFSPTPFTRTLGSLWDIRSMKKNGEKYKYCIPKNVDYGVAITGIVDNKNQTVPVSISIDSWNEPNVTLGEAPKKVNATINISSLTPGEKYVLMKYTDYTKVPDSSFINSFPDKATSFQATGSSITMSDSFMSNTLVIYRCVKAI